MKNEQRFEDLMSRFLDDEISAGELDELANLASTSPERQDELAGQLETTDVIAQSHDELRHSSRFISTLESRMGDTPFMSRIRSAIATDQPSGSNVSSFRQSNSWAIGLAAVSIAATFALLATLILMPTNQPESKPTRIPVAKIAELHGAVQFTGDGGHLHQNLARGQSLYGGTLDLLSTDAWLKLEFPDGSTVTISGQTMLTLTETEHKNLRLRHGNLTASVKSQPRGKPMLINTPTAKLEILGTQFNINSELASTALAVNEGSVRVTRLADGSVAEVLADHQVVASASRQDDFKVAPRPKSVRGWKSSLPKNMIYGTWSPKANGVAAKPLLWSDPANKDEKPILVYVAALSVSRGERPPVQLNAGDKFRIKGSMSKRSHLFIGLTTFFIKGGFAGKYIAHRYKIFPENGGDFSFTIPIEQFKPEKPEYPGSATNLGLLDWWALTVNDNAALTITDVELVPSRNSLSNITSPTKAPLNSK